MVEPACRQLSKRLAFLFSVCLLSVAAWASEADEPMERSPVKLYPRTVAWGQGVTLSLPAQWAEKLDWGPILACFARELMQSGSERARYRLYPRKPGTCAWLAQRLSEGAVFPAMRVQVRPNPELNVFWSPVTRKWGWVRQAIHWQVAVEWRDSAREKSASRLLLTAPPDESAIYRFAPTDGDRLQAVAWPKVTGEIRLAAPWLSVKRADGRWWRFPGPVQSYEVRALPFWAPQNVPVGRLRWRAGDAPLWMEAGRLWRLEHVLEGEDVLPGTLPAWSKNGDAMAHSDMDAMLFSVEETARWQDGRFIAAQRLRWTLRSLSWGRATLPALRTLYFDPADGRLHQAALPERHTWSLPAAAMALLYALGGVLLLAAAASIGLLLWRWGWDGWLAWQRRRLSERSEALWQAMCRWARWRGWPFVVADGPNLTPRKWLALLPPTRRSSWTSSVMRLEREFFGEKEAHGTLLFK